jgi:hypothetical protein
MTDRWDFSKHPQCGGCLNTGWDAGVVGIPCTRCPLGDGAMMATCLPAKIQEWRRANGKIAITGGPRSGKTVLADRLEAIGLPVMRADFLRHSHAWSEVSEEISRWFDEPGSMIVEGVRVPYGLRKWLRAHPTGRPCGLVVWANVAQVPRTPGQESMAKAVTTVFTEIRSELRRRGVEIIEV